MLFAIMAVLFVIVCVFLILLVIIQSDKGGGISGAIGGGLSGASAFLGTQDTANILTRLTTIFATSYMVICIILSLFLSRTTIKVQESELKKRAEQQAKFSPASALGAALPLRAEGDEEAALPMGDAGGVTEGQLPVKEGGQQEK